MCINQLGPYQCWKVRSCPRLCESNFASQPWKMKTKRRMVIHLSLRQIIKEVSHAWNLIFLKFFKKWNSASLRALSFYRYLYFRYWKWRRSKSQGYQFLERSSGKFIWTLSRSEYPVLCVCHERRILFESKHIGILLRTQPTSELLLMLLTS